MRHTHRPLSRGPLSSLLPSGRTGGGDGPVEGTDGRAGARGGVYQRNALDGEVAGGTSKPARAARDIRAFHSGEDAGYAGYRIDQPGKASGQRVAVGRHEVIEPGGGPWECGREDHAVRDG